MALDPLQTWIDALANLPKTKTLSAGADNFAKAICDLTNKVQADATDPASSVEGILTMNSSTFATSLLSLTPVNDTSWAQKVADAWKLGVTSGLITAGTVKNSTAWSASTTDTSTVPTPLTTITTLAAAATQLQTDLSKCTAAATPKKMAEAFRNAALMFNFTCIGTAAAPPGTPVPIPYPAK